MTAINAATSAFRAAYNSSNPADLKSWDSWEARKYRYQQGWGYFENNVYDVVNKHAVAYKSVYGMYKHTRSIYNPTARLVNVHRTHIWGGELDPDAGQVGALPIKTKNEQLRTAIAQLWRDSNWAINKDVAATWGACMGDIMIVVDDYDADGAKPGRVALRIDHPGRYKDLVKDARGFVKGYKIEEKRFELNDKGEISEREFTYSETAVRDGDDVVYRTYRNGRPHGYNDMPAEWRAPYTFVPLVHIQHAFVGLQWGWSELHPALSKFREVDDVASKTGDYVRKTVDAPWLFSGVRKPAERPVARGTGTQEETGSWGDTQIGRTETPVFYGPAEAKATALVANLDLSAVLKHIESLSAQIEREYPELRYEMQKVSGDVSGRAMREARRETTRKIEERRARYDAALVQAHQMAIAIGGMRQYPGYETFSLESFDAGALDHAIDKRAVFADDAMDRVEIDKAVFDAVKAADSLGIPIGFVLKRHGYSDDDIAVIEASESYKTRQAMVALGVANNPPAGGASGDNKPPADGKGGNE